MGWVSCQFRAHLLLIEAMMNLATGISRDKHFFLLGYRYTLCAIYGWMPGCWTIDSAHKASHSCTCWCIEIDYVLLWRLAPLKMWSILWLEFEGFSWMGFGNLGQDEFSILYLKSIWDSTLHSMQFQNFSLSHAAWNNEIQTKRQLQASSPSGPVVGFIAKAFSVNVEMLMFWTPFLHRRVFSFNREWMHDMTSDVRGRTNWKNQHQ